MPAFELTLTCGLVECFSKLSLSISLLMKIVMALRSSPGAWHRRSWPLPVSPRVSPWPSTCLRTWSPHCTCINRGTTTLENVPARRRA